MTALPGQASLRYLSVCSGIEAATQAWAPLGWQPVAFSEIGKFPSAVLAHHYPHVPNWGDMTKYEEWPDADVDVLAGGTPCQSFSVAGLRKGLDDPRGNLMLTFGAIAGRYRPDWLVWENVPGVLSSNGGREFGAFLGMLGELGYGVAYRTLDAQYVRTRRFPHAIPQRRRRVWVVGYLGDWRRAAAVLFDRESLRGDPPPRREARQGPAPTLSARTKGGGGLGTDFDLDGGIIPYALRGEGFDASEDGTGRGTPIVPVAFDCKGSQVQHDGTGASPTLRAMGHANSHANAGGQLAVAFDAQAGGETGLAIGEVSGALHGGGKHGGRAAVAFDLNQITSKTNRSQPDPAYHHTLPASSCPPHLALPWAVRRLTPRECERLMGFPDGFTRIPYRGRAADKCPDGPRYKALGNSWAVNCAEWIGERIAEVDGWDRSPTEQIRRAA